MLATPIESQNLEKIRSSTVFIFSLVSSILVSRSRIVASMSRIVGSKVSLESRILASCLRRFSMFFFVESRSLTENLSLVFRPLICDWMVWISDSFLEFFIAWRICSLSFSLLDLSVDTCLSSHRLALRARSMEPPEMMPDFW